MELIQNSGDILNIVIAVSIALLVFFVCWVLFYMIIVFRNFSEITGNARKNFSKIGEILDLIKEQVENGTFYFSLITDVFKKGVEFLRKKTKKDGKIDNNSKAKTKKNNTKSTNKTKASKNSSVSASKKSSSLLGKRKSKKG